MAGATDWRQVLADNVRAARKSLGLSQEALAFDTGIDRGQRNPSLTLIATLAQHLKTTPAALLTPPADSFVLRKDFSP